MSKMKKSSITNAISRICWILLIFSNFFKRLNFATTNKFLSNNFFLCFFRSFLCFRKRQNLIYDTRICSTVTFKIVFVFNFFLLYFFITRSIVTKSKKTISIVLHLIVAKTQTKHLWKKTTICNFIFCFRNDDKTLSQFHHFLKYKLTMQFDWRFV